jgi:hypothetical protein
MAERAGLREHRESVAARITQPPPSPPRLRSTRLQPASRHPPTPPRGQTRPTTLHPRAHPSRFLTRPLPRFSSTQATIRLRLTPLQSMAERAGFEPAVRLPVHTLSKRALSATQTPLRVVHHRFRPIVARLVSPHEVREHRESVAHWITQPPPSPARLQSLPLQPASRLQPNFRECEPSPRHTTHPSTRRGFSPTLSCTPLTV